jgi:hypothetical protein
VLRQLTPHSFHLIDIRQLLKTDIKIDEIVQPLIGDIVNETANHPQIRWLNPEKSRFAVQGLNFVFTRIRTNEAEADQEITSRVRAKEMCLVHQFNLLDVPKVKKLKVIFNNTTYFLIADECSVVPQERLYEHLTDPLTPAILQLVKFIAKTGCRYTGPQQMVVDPAHPGRMSLFLSVSHQPLARGIRMQQAAEAIFGSKDESSPGLLQALGSEDQFNQVVKEVEQLGIQPNSQTLSLEEVQHNRQVDEFYRQNGIVDNPAKPIAMPDFSDLPRAQELWSCAFLSCHKMTVQQVAEDIVTRINEIICPIQLDGRSIKAKRFVQLNLQRYMPGCVMMSQSKGTDFPPPISKSTLLRWIFDRLKRQGLILSWNFTPKGIYHVQL